MGRSTSKTYTMLFVVGTALLGGIAYLIFADSDGDLIPTIDSKMRGVTEAITGSGEELCSNPVRECEATAEVKVPECDESSARRRVADAIGSPIDNPGCAETARELVASCPEGCRFDFQRLVTVPGSIKLKLSTEPDEAGYCHADGKMAVTLRGTCLRE